MIVISISKYTDFLRCSLFLLAMASKNKLCENRQNISNDDLSYETWWGIEIWLILNRSWSSMFLQWWKINWKKVKSILKMSCVLFDENKNLCRWQDVLGRIRLFYMNRWKRVAKVAGIRKWEGVRIAEYQKGRSTLRTRSLSCSSSCALRASESAGSLDSGDANSVSESVERPENSDCTGPAKLELDAFAIATVATSAVDSLPAEPENCLCSSARTDRSCGCGRHRGEQRYCSRGTRYFPQKSTNFTVSTQEVK